MSVKSVDEDPGADPARRCPARGLRRGAAGTARAAGGRDCGSGAAEDAPARRGRGLPSQSGYDFGDAHTNPDNIVVGPLVITNAVYTEPETIREFGGDKIFVLLQPGHRVTLALSQQTYRVASLGYGPLPQQRELTPQDGHRVVTFAPCPAERASSSAGGKPVTFWAGFMLANTLLCMPIDVWVDDEPKPRKIALGMGVRDCA